MLRNLIFNLLATKNNRLFQFFCFSAIVFLCQSANATSISFNNFTQNEKLLIVSASKKLFEVESKPGLRVQLRNRVLIKVNNQFDDQLLVKMPEVKQVVPVYQGKEFQYFAIDLVLQDKAFVSEINRMMNHFAVMPGVTGVQPDILQLKGKQPLNSTFEKSQNEEHNNDTLLNKISALQKKTLGENVRIAIIDNGVDFSHPELAKVNVQLQYDVLTQTLDASPKLPSEAHGTLVAGVLFAESIDERYSGIAPEAKLIAIRQPDSWTSNTLLAFNVSKLAGADVINCAWRTSKLLQPVYDAVTELSVNGRDGLGTFVVFAAGNNGAEIKPLQTEAGIESAIVVGAQNAAGAPLRYSNFGVTVDTFAYGLPVRSTAPGGQYRLFSGTSLASTIVTGYVALTLSLNPQMKHSDIKF